MIAAAPLGSIMQQHRNKKRAAGLHLANQFTGNGRDFVQLAAFHRPQNADRFDGMLIHRKHVIGVELHQPDHALPIRQKRCDQPSLIQHAHPDMRVLAGQDIKEFCTRRRVAT